MPGQPHYLCLVTQKKQATVRGGVVAQDPVHSSELLLIFQVSQLKHHPLRQASLTTLSKIAPALAYHSLSHHLVLGGCSLLQMCGYYLNDDP